MLTYLFVDNSDELHASAGISSRPSWSQQDATALAGDDILHRGGLHCSLDMSRQCNGHTCLEAVAEMSSFLSVANITTAAKVTASVIPPTVNVTQCGCKCHPTSLAKSKDSST